MDEDFQKQQANFIDQYMNPYSESDNYSSCLEDDSNPNQGLNNLF